MVKRNYSNSELCTPKMAYIDHEAALKHELSCNIFLLQAVRRMVRATKHMKVYYDLTVKTLGHG